ncbi:SPFH/Band 7/PHB domain protein [Vibrio parahaemolyticus]|nr:SPFH/Band 7/PHB domain protein [Vibrio parahaemolyticus]
MIETIENYLTYAIALCFTVVILKSCIVIVEQGQEVIIERFGKYLRTLSPGITFLIPFIDKAAHTISTKETRIQIENIECITKDNASVTCSAVTFIRINNSKTATYNVENLEGSIRSLSISTLRSQIGEMALDETLSQRDNINSAILSTLSPASESYGSTIVRCELLEITPSRSLITSMEQQAVAERERRSTRLNAEAEKEAEIKTAEGEKQAQILRAEANLAQARMEAEAIERKGEAEAKAVKLVEETMKGTDPAAANYFLGQNYIEAFSKIAESDNNKLIMMPMQASGTMGSIAGIAEILGHAKSSS